MRFSIFLFVFTVAVLLAMTFLSSLFSATLPLLEIMAGLAILAFLTGGERFWFAILAGLVVDILHTPAVFSYMPVFLLMAILFWLWDAGVKFEEPILTISRVVVGFLVWPVVWAMVMSFSPGEFQTPLEAWPLTGQAAAIESFFNISQVLLGRDAVFGLLVIGAAAAWRIYAFRRQRLQNLTRL